MINDIRNIVDFIINKESRGYITPLEFNSFAKQAQQEIVDNYFYEYNKAVITRNTRVNTKEILAKTRENMAVFIMPPTALTFSNGFFLPPADLYKTMTVLYNNKEVEEIDRDDLPYHLNDTFSGPSVFYPTYIKYDDKYQVFPTTINSGVSVVYFRKPKDPNWTYQMIGDDAIFNPSAPGYQDLEIGYDDKFEIITRILKYAGLNIREADIVQAAMALDQQNHLEQQN